MTEDDEEIDDVDFLTPVFELSSAITAYQDDVARRHAEWAAEDKAFAAEEDTFDGEDGTFDGDD
jgi:hypothetical protein